MKPKDISKFGVKDSDKPTLVIQVEKGNNKKVYTRLGFEATVIQDGSLVPVTEKLYQYGKLNLLSDSNIYKLKTDKNRKIMRVNISFNSNHLAWAISKTPGSKVNDTFTNPTSGYSNGRIFYTFEPGSESIDYVYLTVFHSNTKSTNEKLTNYVFKYINTEKIELIKDYSVKSPIIKCTKTDNKYSLKFNAITETNSFKVSYFVKLIPRNGFIDGESFNTIAVTESTQKVMEYKNPTTNNNEISLELEDITIDIAYLQITAYVNQGPINEFVSYNSLYFKYNDGRGTDIALILIIIISSILFIVVIVLLVIIIRCNSKNKDLLDRVNKTSFQQEKEDNQQGEGLLYNEEKGGLN